MRRGLLVAAVAGSCFVWAMIVMGLSFAMGERGAPQWWLVPVFGLLTLVVVLVAVHRLVPGAPREPVVPRRAEPVTRVLSESLTTREIEVLEQLAAGRSNQEIARALYVAPGTVKAHLNHIFRKLEAASRLQAVAHARQAGLLATSPAVSSPPPEINPG